MKHEIRAFDTGVVTCFKDPLRSVEQAQVVLQRGPGPEQDLLHTEAGAGLKSKICSTLGQVLAQIEPARRAGPAPHWGRSWPDEQDLVQPGPGSGSDQHKKHAHVSLHMCF